MSKKKVLAILSEYGYWGIELVGPLNKLEAAGYTVDFMTPNGKPADALPPSFDSTYVDPPLGVCVTTKQHEDDVKAFIAKNRTSTPLSLKSYIPERPYYSATNFLRNLEQYYTKVKESVEFLTSEYDALLGRCPFYGVDDNFFDVFVIINRIFFVTRLKIEYFAIAACKGATTAEQLSACKPTHKYDFVGFWNIKRFAIHFFVW